MVDIVVKTLFCDLIPPLGKEEYDQLEQNIVADGCREPLVIWKRKKEQVLIDGHNRYGICKSHDLPYSTVEVNFEDEDEACVWIIKNQFGRRNLAPYTRVELALKLEPLLSTKNKTNQGRRTDLLQNSAKGVLPSDTREQLAKIAGVSHDTIAKGKLVAEHADEETKVRLRTNQVSIHRVAKDIKDKRQKESRKEKRLEAASSIKELDSRIVVGDFREHSSNVPDGSVALIFTDPPYDRKASEMLPALAEFAEAKLAEGGSLICYVGHTQMPAALDAFRAKLRYWWTIACVHSGRCTVMREYGINVGWKSVLWFVKGTRNDNSKMVSDVMSGGEEKTHHDWQQSQSEARYWIDALTEPGDMVCDPFLGGGTTAAAAQSANREWIGFEIDEDNARISSKRIAEL